MAIDLASRRIGFIGCGAMAEALASGLIAAGVNATHLMASDVAPAQRSRFEERLGVKTSSENGDVVSGSDVVVLAVKPGAVASVLRELGASPESTSCLWISIAAGVTLRTLSAALPEGARIVRAMPNTPALVRAGATGLCTNSFARPDDGATAEALFRAVGSVWTAPDESLLDAVTGLSGSGPAYVFVILEALSDAGVRVGLPREASTQLAVQTVYGAALLALETGRHPASLKDQVTSPGGTTIAGLERLEAGGLRAALYEAVAAATARSRELAG